MTFRGNVPRQVIPIRINVDLRIQVQLNVLSKCARTRRRRGERFEKDLLRTAAVGAEINAIADECIDSNLKSTIHKTKRKKSEQPTRQATKYCAYLLAHGMIRADNDDDAIVVFERDDKKLDGGGGEGCACRIIQCLLTTWVVVTAATTIRLSKAWIFIVALCQSQC